MRDQVLTFEPNHAGGGTEPVGLAEPRGVGKAQDRRDASPSEIRVRHQVHSATACSAKSPLANASPTQTPKASLNRAKNCAPIHAAMTLPLLQWRIGLHLPVWEVPARRQLASAPV